MQSKYVWRVLLVLQLLAMLAAIFLFRSLERPLAGLVAGGIFVLVGVLTFLACLRFSEKFKKLNLGVCGIYLFGAAFPMWFVRVATPLSEPVESVFGLPLGVFHHVSEVFFMGIMFVTIAQIYFSRSK